MALSPVKPLLSWSAVVRNALDEVVPIYRVIHGELASLWDFFVSSKSKSVLVVVLVFVPDFGNDVAMVRHQVINPDDF